MDLIEQTNNLQTINDRLQRLDKNNMNRFRIHYASAMTGKNVYDAFDECIMDAFTYKYQRLLQEQEKKRQEKEQQNSGCFIQ